MAVFDRKAGRRKRKFLKIVMALIGLSVLSVSPIASLDNPAVRNSNPAVAAGMDAVPEPGTLLLFGVGIIVLSFQWKFHR